MYCDTLHDGRRDFIILIILCKSIKSWFRRSADWKARKLIRLLKHSRLLFSSYSKQSMYNRFGFAFLLQIIDSIMQRAQHSWPFSAGCRELSAQTGKPISYIVHWHGWRARAQLAFCQMKIFSMSEMRVQRIHSWHTTDSKKA